VISEKPCKWFEKLVLTQRRQGAKPKRKEKGAHGATLFNLIPRVELRNEKAATPTLTLPPQGGGDKDRPQCQRLDELRFPALRATGLAL